MAGVAPYRPNSLDGGNPFLAGDKDGAYVERPVDHRQRRARCAESPASFADHFSQARHVLGEHDRGGEGAHRPCLHVRAWQVLRGDDQAAPAPGAGPDRSGALRAGCAGLGLDIPAPDPDQMAEPRPDPSSPAPRCPRSVGSGRWTDGPSASSSIQRAPWTASTAARRALLAQKVTPLVIAPTGGTLPDGTAIQRSLLTARSVEFDALLVAGAPAPKVDEIGQVDRRRRPASCADDGPEGRAAAPGVLPTGQGTGRLGCGADALSTLLGDQPGILTGTDPAEVTDELLELMRGHRVWERFPAASA